VAEQTFKQDNPPILSLNLSPAARYVAQALAAAPPYLPYEQAWEEITRVEKANRKRQYIFFHLGFTVLTGTGALFGVHHWSGSKSDLLAVFAALIIIAYFQMRRVRD
jgi:hypothetical protein